MSIPSPRRAAPAENLRREVERLRRQPPGAVLGQAFAPVPQYIQASIESGLAVGYVYGYGEIHSFAIQPDTATVMVYDSGAETWIIVAEQDPSLQDVYAADWPTVQWLGVIVRVVAVDVYDEVCILQSGRDVSITAYQTLVPMDLLDPAGYQAIQAGQGVYPVRPMTMPEQDLGRMADVTGYEVTGAGRPTTGSLLVYDRALLDGDGAWTILAAPTTAGQMWQWNGTAWALVTSTTPGPHAASHAAAGSDPLTLAQSQITNLLSDLAQIALNPRMR
jgi:hypothetical protein